MVDVQPFQGVVYNGDIFQDLSLVVAPPYDVVSQEERRQLLSTSPYNIINITVKEENRNISDEDFYSFARVEWKRWIRNQILTRVNQPAIWRTDETYLSPTDEPLTRTGFIALIRLGDYSLSGVQRHERTYVKPKLDRLNLKRSTLANLSPIFFLYLDEFDKAKTFQKNFKPVYRSHANMNQNGSVEIDISYTTDTAWIHQFCSYLNQSAILIADGHHRYEASLALHEECKKDSSIDTAYTLGYFVPSTSEGLILNPTHRGIHSLPNLDYEGFTDKLWNYFNPGTPRLTSQSLPSLQFMYNRNERVSIQIKPDIFLNLQRDLRPPTLASQSVVVFEEIILKKILGLSSSDIAKGKNLKYYPSEDNCLYDLRTEKTQWVFLLEPIDIKDLFSITSGGGVLPQKSTFFYPKCPSGIVMQSLEKP